MTLQRRSKQGRLTAYFKVAVSKKAVHDVQRSTYHRDLSPTKLPKVSTSLFLLLCQEERLKKYQMREMYRAPTLICACAYAKLEKVPGIRYGTMLEKYMIQQYGWTKLKSSDHCGDAYVPNKGINVEIKVSFCSFSKQKFNFVQVRPGHACDFLFVAYILPRYEECMEIIGDNDAMLAALSDLSSLQYFYIPNHQMRTLIMSKMLKASLAHGQTEDDKYSLEAFDTNHFEFAIRGGKNDDNWKVLQEYRISSEEFNTWKM